MNANEKREEELFALLLRRRDEAIKSGREIKRIAVAFESGRDGFWLACWLRARGIEVYVIHAASTAVSREETDDRGRKTRTTAAKDSRRGIPQGSPISPLLTNLYMRRFVLGWKKLGLERCLYSWIVTYADDLVILYGKGKTEEALHYLRAIMSKLKLTVNEEQTRICKVPEEAFDFLGWTFGRIYLAKTGKAHLGNRP